MTSRKCKSLTVFQKVQLIREVEAGGKKKRDIAKKFDIPANTLSTILKSKEKILAAFRNYKNENRKRLRHAENPDVDNLVKEWLDRAKNDDVLLSGPLIRHKAKEFARALGKDNFKGSAGWLTAFQQRNAETLKQITEERTNRCLSPEKICLSTMGFGEELTATGEITDVYIKQEVMDFPNDSTSDEDYEQKEVLHKNVPSLSDVDSATRVIRTFFENESDADPMFVKFCDEVEKFLDSKRRNNNLKQMTASNFIKCEYGNSIF